MPELTEQMIEEFRRLESGATAGPWMVDSTVALGAYGVWRDGTTLADDEPMQQVCSMLPMERRFEQERRDADANIIVFLRNHGKAAFDRLADLERLREAVEKLKNHRGHGLGIPDMQAWFDEEERLEEEITATLAKLTTTTGETK